MALPSPAPERLPDDDQGPQKLGIFSRSFALDLGYDMADREISTLHHWLTNINKALIHRGEAGCSHCLDTAKALDLYCSETSTWCNHPEGEDQQRQLLFHTLIQARHAFYGCSQHKNISNDNIGASPGTDHLLKLSTFAPSSSSVINLPSNQQSKSHGEDAEKDANCARTDLGTIEINTRSSDSSSAKRASIKDQMLSAVMDRNCVVMMGPANDLSWFDGPTNIAPAPVAAGRPCPEVAKDITVALVSAMTQRPSKITNNERFLLFCVLKVLDSMKVPVHEIMQKFAPRHRPNSRALKYQLQGVGWANKLMEDLYSRGWGHRALDLLLFWNLTVCRYALLKFGRKPFYDSLVETLARPEYRNKFPSGSVRVNESIPSIVQATLQGTVSYRDICTALGYSSNYVDVTTNAQDCTSPTPPTSHVAQKSGVGQSEYFDGSDIVVNTKEDKSHKYPKNLELALDAWLAEYPTFS